MLSKYINQFMKDNDLLVNEAFFIENMDGERIKLGFADSYKNVLNTKSVQIARFLFRVTITTAAFFPEVLTDGS